MITKNAVFKLNSTISIKSKEVGNLITQYNICETGNTKAKKNIVKQKKDA